MNTAGQTLVEVIVATSVVALVMTAIVAIVTVSVRNTAQAKAKALATKYSQEGVEYFRQKRTDLGWESFYSILAEDGTTFGYCLASLPATNNAFQALTQSSCTASQAVDARGMFRRDAAVTLSDVLGVQIISVLVTVRWQEGTITRESRASQDFRKATN